MVGRQGVFCATDMGRRASFVLQTCRVGRAVFCATDMGRRARGGQGVLCATDMGRRASGGQAGGVLRYRHG